MSDPTTASAPVAYLDHAATTPVRREVLEAMWPLLAGECANPSSHHAAGERAADALADARERVAAVLGARAGDIVFTSGGSEADNLAIKGIAVAAMERGARHVVTTAIEHEAVLQSVVSLGRVHGFESTVLLPDHEGLVTPEAVAAAVRADTAVVSIGLANNEVGAVQPMREIADAIAAVRGGRDAPGRAWLHTDAVQAAGWMPLRVGELGVDALTIAGHKLGAPVGTGALFVRGRIPLEALVHGGGQERGRRSGTESVAGAVGLATALELADAEVRDGAATMAAWRDAFVAEVRALVPSAVLTGPLDASRRLPGIASFVFPGTSGEAVLLELERRGVVASSGSACAAGDDEPSHVLVAMGVDGATAQTSVRFSAPHPVPGGTDPFEGVAPRVAAAVAAVSGLGR